MENVFLRPACDSETGKPLVVRDPFSRQILAAEGEWKPRTQFWLRRLRDHDVFAGDPSRTALDDGSPQAAAESQTASTSTQAAARPPRAPAKPRAGDA